MSERELPQNLALEVREALQRSKALRDRIECQAGIEQRRLDRRERLEGQSHRRRAA